MFISLSSFISKPDRSFPLISLEQNGQDKYLLALLLRDDFDWVGDKGFFLSPEKYVLSCFEL